jgi:hypothetical protein
MKTQFDRNKMVELLRELTELAKKYQVSGITGCVVADGIIAPFQSKPVANILPAGDEAKINYMHGRILGICGTEMNGLKIGKDGAIKI